MRFFRVLTPIVPNVLFTPPYRVLTLSKQDGGSSEANAEFSVQCRRFTQGYNGEISGDSGEDF